MQQKNKICHISLKANENISNFYMTAIKYICVFFTQTQNTYVRNIGQTTLQGQNDGQPSVSIEAETINQSITEPIRFN